MTLYSWFTQHASAVSQDKAQLRKVGAIDSCKYSMWPIALVRKKSTNKKHTNKV